MKVGIAGVEFGRDDETNQPLYKVVFSPTVLSVAEYTLLNREINTDDHTVQLEFKRAKRTNED